MSISDEARVKSQASTPSKSLEEYQVPKWFAYLHPVIINGDIKLEDAKGNPISQSELFIRGSDMSSSPLSDEYCGLLRNAYEQALHDNGVEDTYKDLILNQEKSMKVKQDVYKLLSENKRAMELMSQFGISLS